MTKQLTVRRRNHVRDLAGHNIATRLERWRLSDKCAEFTDEGIAWLGEVLRNKPRTVVKDGKTFQVWDYTTDDRFKAFDRLMDRAFGRPYTPVEIDERQTMLKKIIHEVKWLPPDPDDHSRVIEPEPVHGDGKGKGNGKGNGSGP